MNNVMFKFLNKTKEININDTIKNINLKLVSLNNLKKLPTDIRKKPEMCWIVLPIMKRQSENNRNELKLYLFSNRISKIIVSFKINNVIANKIIAKVVRNEKK